ncbi:MAG: ankyrin repeat domain-containing protein [Planctomycetia bacterium]|nr:ankyrin repeat domain-containing protein [Planctomycetia bacterium]
MVKKVDSAQLPFDTFQTWKCDAGLTEFKNICQILRIDGNVFRVAVEFSTEYSDLYDHYAAILSLSQSALQRSISRLVAKKARPPRWLLPHFDLASIGGVVFIAHETTSINAGLLLALDALLTMPIAIRAGRLDRVEKLITDDPTVLNRPVATDDKTPLMIAASEDQPAIADYLIDHGAQL